MTPELDSFPQPIQAHKKVNTPSRHPVLLLVGLYEGVLGLSSLEVHLGAHSVHIASHAGVFPAQARLAKVGWLVFYQPFLYQPVS